MTLKEQAAKLGASCAEYDWIFNHGSLEERAEALEAYENTYENTIMLLRFHAEFWSKK